ncbi:predicted leucine/isoleucine/valine-binding protein LS-BP precursor LivK [Desulforapulum autotrophicum HRM2]|uniref:Predicted leucine/isoleucine/valine-binding protein LS-BP LivK n=1 Tax=Desulforapulum autotrophicum (strain ATCC 43914 / DSM 3382 / VKM B-1955 / HRM2) TaxID=177437 RepID=C0QE35_DESAH|nr:ABC transporter substrate-binding protein [Desulforapulum autotrophicum]ACN13152.1 predicted leucine/isoleucine/valine-binding protein LS-BP precursor LivK [Desulforapulum autotrophicum HRM2]
MIQRLGILLVFMVILGCTRGEDILSPGENQTGITTDEIRIGSSLALGGHAGYLGTHMLHGAMAYINHINETGGIHGRKINLIALDDGYDPARCLYNTQQLIAEHGVFSLFCYVGTPTTVRIIPLVNEAKIPLLGMLTGANRLREPFNRFLINSRASYYQEISAAVDLMVKKYQFDRVAVFYQYDEYGLDGLRGAEIALKQYDLIPVAKGTYVRGTIDVETGLEQIAASKAQAVVMIGTYDSCARFIQLARIQQFAPLFYNVSFVGSKELARRLGPLGEGVLVTQVVPPPHALEDGMALPGVKDYMEMLKRYYPSSLPSFVGLEGYINAKILVRGLELSGRELTRKKFINAIESIHEFDLGIQNPLSFARDDHQGLDRVYFTQIKQGRLVLFP